MQGGKAAIDLSHFIGAVYGMENMMGRPGGPVSAPLRPLHGTPSTIVLRVLWVLDKTPERLRVLWVLLRLWLRRACAGARDSEQGAA